MASERILCTGTIVAGGEVQWHISPLTGEVEVSDADTAVYLDEAAELEEYQDDILDREFWRQGGLVMQANEWEVNYNDGKGWAPVDEQTMRRQLAGTYASVAETLQRMRDFPTRFHANTGYSTYRRKPAVK